MNNAINTFLCGTSLIITVILTKPSPSSVKIIIKDPSDYKLINEVSMGIVSTKIYEYVFQSSTVENGGMEGEYIAIIKTCFGNNTSIIKRSFILEEA